ncbi:MAG: DUF7333 family protein [Halobacteriota archaeon]
MEFTAQTTALLFAIPLLVIVGGTVTSPMPQPLSIGISVGIAVFGVFSLLVGVKHGEYRASN